MAKLSGLFLVSIPGSLLASAEADAVAIVAPVGPRVILPLVFYASKAASGLEFRLKKHSASRWIGSPHWSDYAPVARSVHSLLQMLRIRPKSTPVEALRLLGVLAAVGGDAVTELVPLLPDKKLLGVTSQVALQMMELSNVSTGFDRFHSDDPRFAAAVRQAHWRLLHSPADDEPLDYLDAAMAVVKRYVLAAPAHDRAAHDMAAVTVGLALSHPGLTDRQRDADCERYMAEVALLFNDYRLVEYERDYDAWNRCLIWRFAFRGDPMQANACLDILAGAGRLSPYAAFVLDRNGSDDAILGLRRALRSENPKLRSASEMCLSRRSSASGASHLEWARQWNQSPS